MALFNQSLAEIGNTGRSEIKSSQRKSFSLPERRDGIAGFITERK